MGPILSSEGHKGIHPVLGIRPNVGRSPTVPHLSDGDVIEPSVSVPIENAHSPAAVALADPALEPLEPSSTFQGFFVFSPNHTSP